MKVTKKTRLLSLVMSVLLAFGFIGSFTTVSSAASGPLKAVQYETIYAGSTTMGCLNFEPNKSDPSEKDWAKVDKCVLVSIKSSNTKVLKAKKYGTEMYEHYLEPVKTGKAKVTVKYKYNGKKYTITKKVAVKKYPDAIKSIKVNGKSVNLDKKAYRFDYDVEKYKKTSAKIKIKAASGWEISDAYMISVKGETDKFKTLKPSVFTKGTSITVKKGYDAYIFVTLACTSGANEGDTFTYAVRFFRKSFD